MQMIQFSAFYISCLFLSVIARSKITATYDGSFIEFQSCDSSQN